MDKVTVPDILIGPVPFTVRFTEELKEDFGFHEIAMTALGAAILDRLAAAGTPA